MADTTVPAQIIPDIVRQILATRGMPDDAMMEFLYSDYTGGLHDPFALRDMDKAVARIARAARDHEPVVVYGDYDIDGITASCVMLETLESLGITAKCYIPDRFEEGYGINQEALEQIKGEGASLVISVDCGITSVHEAEWARSCGLDLIITDHHSVPEVIPEAVAVINPKRADDTYPFKDLAGVGVAFKLALALQAKLGNPAAGQEKWLLDLVALGTICDVVPLVGENRVLASFGLRVLRKTRRVGLVELARVAGVDIREIRAYHLGYVLGPRMNAAGRLTHALRSVELLRTSDGQKAAQLAKELDELNQERRREQQAIVEEATEMAQAFYDAPVLVLADAKWSHGVVGIVASSLVEKWHKPVIVAQVLGALTKGSARSVPGFSMVDALRANKGLLTKYGGHFFAAGCTFPTENLEALRAGLARYRQELPTDQAADPVAARDIEIRDLGGLSMQLLDILELLEPCGSGNPQPLFFISGIRIVSMARVGAKRDHLKVTFEDENGVRISGIGFRLGEMQDRLGEGELVRVTAEVNKNEWRGVQSVQLIVRDIQSD